MLDTDEAALARALLQGEAGAAWAAWHRFAPKVRRTIERRMGDGPEVDDVLQQVFVCFFERIPTLQQPESVRAFLISITLNILRAEARRNRDRRALVRGLVEPPSSFHPNPEAREALARFCAILDRLAPPDATAFIRRFVDDEDLADLASNLGVSLSTIKRRLARACRRVRAQLKRDPALSSYLSTKYYASAMRVWAKAS